MLCDVVYNNTDNNIMVSDVRPFGSFVYYFIWLSFHSPLSIMHQSFCTFGQSWLQTLSPPHLHLFILPLLWFKVVKGSHLPVSNKMLYLRTAHLLGVGRWRKHLISSKSDVCTNETQLWGECTNIHSNCLDPRKILYIKQRIRCSLIQLSLHLHCWGHCSVEC